MMFSEEPITSAQLHFLSRLGLMLVYWNQVESSMKRFINFFVGDGWPSTILVAHMGSSSLCDAIRTLSNQYAADDQKEHLTHLVTFFEILREYRNYYAHTVENVYPNGQANLHSWSARSTLIMHDEIIAADNIDVFLEDCKTLSRYATSLQLNHFKSTKLGEAMPDELTALPDKPKLPDRLAKNRQLIQPSPPPPRSSRG